MDFRRALQNKTSCTLSIISPTTTDLCLPPGTQAPDFPSAPRTKPFSRSESGLGWGRVSHSKNHPLFPLTQPPPPSAHTDTQSEADTTPQPTHCSPPVPRNFPSVSLKTAPPRAGQPPHSHLFLSCHRRRRRLARRPLSPTLSLRGTNGPPRLPVLVLTKGRGQPGTSTKTDTHRLLADRQKVDAHAQGQAGRPTHF